MTDQIADFSQRKAAIIAGLSYLAVFVLTPHAWINKLFVHADAAATFANFSASESLLRAGIVCWLIVLAADALVAWALYYFFKPADKNLSFLAACFRLVYVAVMAAYVLKWGDILQLLAGADYLKVLDQSQLDVQVMLHYEAYRYGMNFAFMFFGIHIGIVGYLVLRSGYIPRAIGALLVLAFAGYMINSVGFILSPRYANNEVAFWVVLALPAVISEFGLTIALLLKGGKAMVSRPA